MWGTGLGASVCVITFNAPKLGPCGVLPVALQSSVIL